MEFPHLRTPPLFLIWLILDFLLHVFKSTYRWNCCFCYLFIYFCCRCNVYQNIMDYLDNKLLVWSFENDFPLHFYFFIKSFLKESEETTNILKIHKFFDLCIKETKYKNHSWVFQVEFGYEILKKNYITAQS